MKIAVSKKQITKVTGNITISWCCMEGVECTFDRTQIIKFVLPMNDLRKKTKWMFVLEVLIYLAVAISISLAITL